MGGKLSTGISALDRHLNGGLNAGDILSVVASPTTQSQTLLYQLMNERPTLYVTPLRPERSVERDITNGGGVACDYRIEAVGSDVSMDSEVIKDITGSRTYTGNSALKEDPLDKLYDLIERVEGPSNVIVSPMTPFERGDSREAYNEVLSKLAIRMQNAGGLGVLHCHSMETVPPFRDITMTAADVVWQLSVDTEAGDKIKYKLRVPKNRGGRIITEELSLELAGRRVSIDESRTI